MSATRVYELAKELGLQPADLMATLRDLGVEVASHSSSIDQSTVEAVRELLANEPDGGGKVVEVPQQVVVRDLAELADAVAGARREAESAFGDATVFCEPYVERGHHIEVQVMADEHGEVWTVGERECSIQRRHQKIIEESPSTIMTPELRREMGKAAVAAARAGLGGDSRIALVGADFDGPGISRSIAGVRKTVEAITEGKSND